MHERVNSNDCALFSHHYPAHHFTVILCKKQINLLKSLLLSILSVLAICVEKVGKNPETNRFRDFFAIFQLFLHIQFSTTYPLHPTPTLRVELMLHKSEIPYQKQTSGSPLPGPPPLYCFPSKKVCNPRQNSV